MVAVDCTEGSIQRGSLFSSSKADVIRIKRQPRAEVQKRVGTTSFSHLTSAHKYFEQTHLTQPKDIEHRHARRARVIFL